MVLQLLDAGSFVGASYAVLPQERGYVRAAGYQQGDARRYGVVPGSTADQSAALQRWRNACFGTPASPVDRGDYLFAFCPVAGDLPCYNTVDFSNISGAVIAFAARRGSRLVRRSSNIPVIYADCISYSRFDNLTIEDEAGGAAALLEIDGTTSFPGALKPQQMTFIDLLLNGNNLGSRGYRFGLVGTSAAQGDTFAFVNPLILQCTVAGAEVIGFNALGQTFFGGNIQVCNLDGIAVRGGQVIVYGMNFENQFNDNQQVRQRGADVNVYGAISPSRLKDVRSESPCLSRGAVTIDNCETYAAGFFSWAAETPYDDGDIVVGTPSVATANGHAYRAVVASLTEYVHADATGDQQHIFHAGAGWTVNEWVGTTLIMRYPNGFAEGRQVASNTADEVILTAPLSFAYIIGGISYGDFKFGGETGATEPDWAAVPVTGYFYQAAAAMTAGSDIVEAPAVSALYIGQAICVTGAGDNGDDLLTTIVACPDATHLQLADAAGTTVTAADIRIEPLVTDGQIQWMFYEFDAVQAPIDVKELRMQYGRISPSAVQTRVVNSKFSRKDWIDYRQLLGGAPGDFLRRFAESNNSVGLGSVFAEAIAWSAIPGLLESMSADRKWSYPVLFDGGESNNPFSRSVGITRGDGTISPLGSADDICRNVLGVFGTIAPPTKSGVDQAGDDLVLQGGLGTGAGGGGRAVIRTQPAGASGSNVGNSLEALVVDNTGRVTTPLDGVIYQFIQGAGSSQAAGVTQYYTLMGAGGQLLQVNRQFVVPTKKTFKNMTFLTGTAQPAGGSLVLTVQKNGVDTALQLVVPAGAAAGVFSDNGAQVTFNRGDVFSVKGVNNDGANPSCSFYSGSIVAT